MQTAGLSTQSAGYALMPSFTLLGFCHVLSRHPQSVARLCKSEPQPGPWHEDYTKIMYGRPQQAQRLMLS